RGTQIDRECHAIRYLQRPAGPGNLCSHKQDSTPLAAPLSTAALEPAREPGFVEDHPAAEAAGEGKAAGARLAIEPVFRNAGALNDDADSQAAGGPGWCGGRRVVRRRRPKPKPQRLQLPEDLGDVEVLDLVGERVQLGGEVRQRGGGAGHACPCGPRNHTGVVASRSFRRTSSRTISILIRCSSLDVPSASNASISSISGSRAQSATSARASLRGACMQSIAQPSPRAPA